MTPIEETNYGDVRWSYHTRPELSSLMVVSPHLDLGEVGDSLQSGSNLRWLKGLLGSGELSYRKNGDGLFDDGDRVRALYAPPLYLVQRT